MKIHQFIERYFWIFLTTGLLFGLSYPVYNNFLMTLLKSFLMVMLFLVYLKTDVMMIFQKMKNYRYMTYLVLTFMVIIPLSFFEVLNLFNRDLATGILLLTAMPAAAVSPVLTDVVKGNTVLSASILILTSIIAPVSVPFLFWLLRFDHLSIDPLMVFKDLAVIVFLPMILSLGVKKYFSTEIRKSAHLFISINIILLSIMVYAVIGSQRDLIFTNSFRILWQISFLYLIFILLHVMGFLAGHKQDIKGKLATSIGAAYMNNSMAIVLAALYFEPSILVLMVLSEVPWNTMLMPFSKMVTLMESRQNNLKSHPHKFRL